ncbi:hypothetical protein [Flavobacterium cerinum]|uniref:YcxB family protein n=1 Tax=Flavobacterium cerinum TaxID=2502784 RepID=A0ABY5IPJ8_9FLAO|nr:hypothetical protein [Flavobacterium cerinum]UUC44725.1 hypothetical protein NOX80_13930 [Flavobacterium cerinum]
MKSKLTYQAYIQVGLIIPTLILPVYLFIKRGEAFGENYNIKFLFVGSLMLITCLFLFVVILRRVISVNLSDNEIVVKNILQSELKIKFKDLDGFETTFETSKGGKSYEILYLIKDNKVLVHISEFHFSNYKEIKNKVRSKLKDCGFVPFSYFSDWKRYR